MTYKLSQSDKQKLELIKLRKELQDQLDQCFDPNDLTSRPNGLQLEMLQDDKHNVIFVVAPNRSGKSQSVTRAASWWLQDNHPYIPKRPEWGDSYNILVVGRTTTILTEELWEGKIRKFLPSGSYKEKRGSSGIETVRHLETGNKLIFMSHHDAKNAREKVQGFTSPIVILDEMPDDASLVTELIMRTVTNNGIFIASFTPLVENEGVRKIVDKGGPRHKRYIFRPEDNPFIIRSYGTIEAYDAELKSLCATEAEYRARRFGEWYYSSGRVIRSYDPKVHKEPIPKNYHPLQWRHVAVVDPSASGLTGLTVWAENPKTAVWYNVMAETLQGEAAFSLVKEIEEKIEGFYIVDRICDCNPAGFYREAHRQGVMYAAFSEKMERKNLLIDKLNEVILQGRIKLTSASEALEEEFFNCKWSEHNPDKIVHSSKWHLIDTARYFADRIPKPETKARTFSSQLHALKQEWNEGQEKQAAAISKKKEIAEKKKQQYKIQARKSKFNRSTRKGNLSARVQ